MLAESARKNPTNPQVHYLLGKLREAQGRSQAAFEAYKQAVALDPQYVDAIGALLAHRSNVLVKRAEWDEMVFKLAKVNPLRCPDALGEVWDLARMWRVLDELQGRFEQPPESLYVMAAARDAQKGEGRWRREPAGMPTPGTAIANHSRIRALLNALESTRQSRW